MVSLPCVRESRLDMSRLRTHVLYSPGENVVDLKISLIKHFYDSGGGEGVRAKNLVQVIYFILPPPMDF